MKAAVFYATREHHTRRVADHIAGELGRFGIETDLLDVRYAPIVDWTRYTWVFVAASVHLGRHEPEMIAFVKRYRPELERLDAAFLSVSLSEAGAEDVTAPMEQRMESASDVGRMIDRFIENTGWKPAHTLPVAGALAYSQYNFLIRFVMKRIARKAGAPTDVSRDYELTDWPIVDRFVDRLVSHSGR